VGNQRLAALLALLAGSATAIAESAPDPATAPDAAEPADPAEPDDDPAIAADPGGAAAAAPWPPPPADPVERARWLKEQLDVALAGAPQLITSRVGATVVDVRTGDVLWSHQADRPLNLASVTKVLTTAAALDALGTDFRWRTSLLAEKLNARTGTVEGDLFIRGRGDPTLTVAGLGELAQTLAWRGITEITGDLVFDGSYFDLVDEPPRYADQPKERAGYRAPIGAASLERNSVTVVVAADRAGLGLAEVSLAPPLTGYVRLVDTAVATVTSGRTRVFVSTHVKRDHIELRVSGQILADEGVYFLRRRIDDPARMFGEALRAALDERGIRVRGRKIGRGLTPADAILVAERDSPPLGDVVRSMAKWSDNYVAETVLKTLGAETRPVPAPPAIQPPATWGDGVAAVQRYLADKAGVAPGGYRYENGSGLYDSTAIPADAVAKVLVAGWRDFRVGPDLASSLATGGVDGTLRRRFGDPSVRGRVRAKTGTLATVSTLAGYAGADSSRPLAFVVLINSMASAGRADARRLQDTIAALAVAYTAP
jgi:D-alanyl-D-alanine carboxypeptidase/D-alanyl-D-alanine-endopeptidase (penicillin-binding protein 4)